MHTGRDAVTVETTSEAFERAAADADAGTRVPVEVRVEVADPWDAYRRARTDAGGVFFETTGGQPGWSYFATEPVVRHSVAADDVDDDAVDSGTGVEPGPSLRRLAEWVDAESLARGDCDVPYPCGFFGWLSYDVVREFEDIPDTTTDDRGLPRLQLDFYDRVAAWEEPRGDGPTTLRVVACPVLGDGPHAASEAYETGRAAALDLVEGMRTGDPAVESGPFDRETYRVESSTTPGEYADRVRAVKQYIYDGDTFQANISQRLETDVPLHPVAVYDALRQGNPAPYSALLEFPGVDLVSASPELLLHRDGDRLVTEPIAGTRPRGTTEAEDREFEAEIRTSEKERAEHAMLVDLERNDLGKVSEYGSVEVAEYRRIDRYSEVMHLVSKVVGRLRPGKDLADAIAAVFPGGTITGAPKPRTMEIIDELESRRRGPYTGAIGVVGVDDRATLSMTIRTLTRHEGTYALRVGGGVVHDSDPHAEYGESLDKARALVTALETALDGRADLEMEDASRRDLS
jgi:anthranilate synthase component 1